MKSKFEKSRIWLRSGAIFEFRLRFMPSRKFRLGTEMYMFSYICGVEKIIIKNDISGPHKKCQTGGNFIHGNGHFELRPQN